MKNRRRKSLYKRRLRRTKKVPGQVVPGVLRVVGRIVIGIQRRFVGDVHPEARFAGDFLDDEKPTALIIRKIVAVDGPFRFFDRQVKAEEAQVRINLGAEEWKFEFLIELLRSQGPFRE